MDKKSPSMNRSLIVLIAVVVIFILALKLLPQPTVEHDPKKQREIFGPPVEKVDPRPMIPPPPPSPKPPEETVTPHPDFPEEETTVSPGPEAVPPVVSKPKPAVPHVGAAACKATVPEGGALLTGGWEMPNGDHMFALITPEPLANGVVAISSKIFTVASSNLTDTAWESIITPTEKGLHLNAATYTKQELARFKENYKVELANMVSHPKVISKYGQSATIEVSGADEGLALSIKADKQADETDLAVSVLNWTGGPLPGRE
jgi:hypothetical protein